MIENQFCPEDWGMLPILEADQSCPIGVGEGEVCAIILVHKDGTRPADWTSLESWQAVLSNTENLAPRFLAGIGSITEPERTTTTVGHGVQINPVTRFRASIRSLFLSDLNFDFLRYIDHARPRYRVYLKTVGGYLLGSQNGISPETLNVNFIYPEGRGNVRYANVLLSWQADCFLQRTYLPTLGEQEANPLPRAIGYGPDRAIGYGPDRVIGYSN